MNPVDAKFGEFHLTHPEVYEFLVEAARKHIRSHPSMKTLLVLARMEGFQVNDLFAGRYARLIAKQEPDLARRFEFRSMRT